MTDFSKAINRNSALISDGAMGTLLQKHGMPAGVSPEAFALEEPQLLTSLHKEYIDAGSDIITTNTFGGTRFKLEADIETTAFNRKMAQAAVNARASAQNNVWIAGSVGPTGLFTRPMGELTLEELVDAFCEQIKGLVDGGVDFILGETIFDLAEAKAIVLAARRVCNLPVGVSMTFESGASLTGSTPLIFLETMQNMGVDFVGVNCSAGPEQFVDIAKEMQPALEIPLLMYPNAGLPVLENGETVFKLPPQEFAEQTSALLDLGATMLGGCCGSTPDHIKALAGAAKDRPLQPRVKGRLGVALTSRTELVEIAPGKTSIIIGERINPTGKKKLAAELQSGEFTEAMRFAEEQVDIGARVLDVNVGAPMVDEPALLPQLVETLCSRFQTPLCLDSSDPEAIRTGLFAYPGAPLVNSISGEPGRMEMLGPLCKEHGAPFILLPLAGKKLPISAKDRISVLEELLKQADALGIPRRLILVDVLALTVSSKPEAALACLETIKYVTETLELPTVYGLSNISFGLPARELINSSFLTMSMASGLSALIANPNSARLREVLAAGEVLLNRDPQASSFIAGYSDWKPGAGGGAAAGKVKKDAKSIEESVILGDNTAILPLVEKALEEGEKPEELVNKRLIPAITEVGDKFEKKEYYLPQLLASAEAMQTAFNRLLPLLEQDAGHAERPVVVMATVEGDIHDIGKNIVCLMLKNHGFEVVDLGKDVAASTIIDAAVERKAALVGLSALMTTTMVRMEDVVSLAKKRDCKARIFVGGAVVSASYAEKIGADGYAADAVEAVRLAEQLSAEFAQPK